MKKIIFLTFLLSLSVAFISKAANDIIMPHTGSCDPFIEAAVINKPEYKGCLGSYYIDRTSGSTVTVAVSKPSGFRGAAGPYASPSWRTDNDYVYITYSTDMLSVDNGPAPTQIAVGDGYYLITLIYTR